MDNGIILCLVTALGFGAWPLIARASGANAAWSTTVIMTTTVLVGTALQARLLPVVPSGRALVVLVIAGITNGIGMVAYGRLVAGTEFEVSRLAPAALTLMIAFIAIGGVVCFGEVLTVKKVAGILCAALAAWLLTK